MHETVLAASLLRLVLEAAGRHETPEQKLRVQEIDLELGLLACVEAVTLQGCFELLAEGTAADRADLKITRRPLSGFCPDCRSRVRTLRREFSCPACGGNAVDWQGGNEMEINAIRVVPDIPAEEHRQ